MLDFDTQTCAYPRCKKSAVIAVWVHGRDFGVCQEHWDKHCAESEQLACSGRWTNGEPNTTIEKALARSRRKS